MRSTILLYGLATLHLAASLPVVARDPTPRPPPHPRLPKTNPKVPDSNSKRQISVVVYPTINLDNLDARISYARDSAPILSDATIKSDNSISAPDPLLDISEGDKTLDTNINSDSSISARDPLLDPVSDLLKGLPLVGGLLGSGGGGDLLGGSGSGDGDAIDPSESEQSANSHATSDHPPRVSTRDPEPGLLDSLTPPKADTKRGVHHYRGGSDDDDDDEGIFHAAAKVVDDILRRSSKADKVAVSADTPVPGDANVHADAPATNTPRALVSAENARVNLGAATFDAGETLAYDIKVVNKRVDSTPQLNSEAAAEAAAADEVAGSADAEVAGTANAHAGASITVTSRDSNSGEKGSKGSLLGGLLIPGIL